MYDLVSNNLKDVKDIDESYASLAKARSPALNGELDKAREYDIACNESIEPIQDEEDRSICKSDFDAGPWYGLREG
ncbi:MAG: hypothetical protein IPM69_13010 [Ignavibacteria bacterium]|nr:hypothetical protein [Ignavibacteria bacterium]